MLIFRCCKCQDANQFDLAVLIPARQDSSAAMNKNVSAH
jgi:hypothetical protein